MNAKAEKEKSIFYNWQLWLFASLTLGLAPFVPEPHLWGKLQWVGGGAVGMELMDWLDLLFHGFPWVFLLLSIFFNIKPTPTDGEVSANH